MLIASGVHWLHMPAWGAGAAHFTPGRAQKVACAKVTKRVQATSTGSSQGRGTAQAPLRSMALHTVIPRSAHQVLSFLSGESHHTSKLFDTLLSAHATHWSLL